MPKSHQLQRDFSAYKMSASTAGLCWSIKAHHGSPMAVSSCISTEESKLLWWSLISFPAPLHKFCFIKCSKAGTQTGVMGRHQSPCFPRASWRHSMLHGPFGWEKCTRVSWFSETASSHYRGSLHQIQLCQWEEPCSQAPEKHVWVLRTETSLVLQ